MLTSFAADFGIDRDTSLRIAAGFGGGLARTGATCGAVTGGLMVLGLKYGATVASDTATKEKAYRIGQEFMRAFSECMGSIPCKKLVGYDIIIPAERQKATDAGVFQTVCPRAIATAVALIQERL